MGVPDPRPKGEVIATDLVVRGRREGGAPGTRCSMSERASTSVSPEAADSAAKRARRDAGAYTEARATAAPRRRSGGELEFKLTTSTKARTASVEMSVRAAYPPACPLASAQNADLTVCACCRTLATDVWTHRSWCRSPSATSPPLLAGGCDCGPAPRAKRNAALRFQRWAGMSSLPTSSRWWEGSTLSARGTRSARRWRSSHASRTSWSSGGSGGRRRTLDVASLGRPPGVSAKQRRSGRSARRSAQSYWKTLATDDGNCERQRQNVLARGELISKLDTAIRADEVHTLIRVASKIGEEPIDLTYMLVDDPVVVRPGTVAPRLGKRTARLAAGSPS